MGRREAAARHLFASPQFTHSCPIRPIAIAPERLVAFAALSKFAVSLEFFFEVAMNNGFCVFSKIRPLLNNPVDADSYNVALSSAAIPKSRDCHKVLKSPRSWIVTSHVGPLLFSKRCRYGRSNSLLDPSHFAFRPFPAVIGVVKFGNAPGVILISRHGNTTNLSDWLTRPAFLRSMRLSFSSATIALCTTFFPSPVRFMHSLIVVAPP